MEDILVTMVGQVPKDIATRLASVNGDTVILRYKELRYKEVTGKYTGCFGKHTGYIGRHTGYIGRHTGYFDKHTEYDVFDVLHTTPSIL